MASNSLLSAFKQTLWLTNAAANSDGSVGQDITIKFISAEGLPKMDVVGQGDPYFVAKIDGKITYTSTILCDTSTPKWDDEELIVRNVPLNAKLVVSLYDKDDDALSDDYIGRFEVTNLNDYKPLPRGHPIAGPSNRVQGYFHLTIESIPASLESQKLRSYTFDGPCRYSRHNSTIAGRLTMLNSDCVYSTWKVELRQLFTFFPPHAYQYWNKQYARAQSIFNGGARSFALQTPIKMAHKVVYGQTLKNSESGRLESGDDLWNLVLSDRVTNKIRPVKYTYVIDDTTWRFSETGIGYFTDFCSKHALHSNCSEYVRYAGEFHPRPKFGWDRMDDEWELVFDNKSGTYSPAIDLLPNLKDLLLFNFPGLDVVVYDFKDPKLKESIEELKVIEKKYKAAAPTINNLVCLPPTLKQ